MTAGKRHPDGSAQYARRMGFVLALGLAATMATMYFRQGQSVAWLALVFDRAVTLVVALFVVLSAVAAGLLLLPLVRARMSGPVERLVFALGLGLGAVALAALILGLLGLLHQSLAAVVLALPIGAAVRRLKGLAGDLAATAREKRAGINVGTVLWILIALFFFMNLTRAFEPVWEYDVQEYHLGAPAQFHRAGRVWFLRDNVYANFPQNIETVHLLCMSLTGSEDAGAATGKVVNVLLGLATALALHALGRRLFSPTAGHAAAAFFYLWPGVSLYSGLAYVTLGLIFFTVLALYAFMRFAFPDTSEDRRSTGWLVAAGLMAGIAAGCKYTALLFVAAPLTIGIAAALASTGWRSTVKGAAAFLGCCLLALSPWLVKNLAHTGNPTYPLLYSVFRGGNWDDVKDARWTQAHLPGDKKPTPTGAPRPSRRDDTEPCPAAKALAQQFPWAGHEGCADVLLLIPFVLVASRRWWRKIGALVIYVGIYWLLWFFFTHRIDRFLEPTVGVIALLSGCGVAALAGAVAERMRATGWKSAGTFALAAFLVLAPSRGANYHYFARSLGTFVGATSAEQFMRRTDFREGYAAMRFVNSLGRRDARVKVLFLGEARTFYCRVPFLASTVFDTHPLEKLADSCADAEHLYANIHKAGVTHVLVNTAELRRLQETYRFVYNGRAHIGMLDGFNWRLFDEFARGHLRLLKVFAGAVDGFRWRDWEALSERRPARQSQRKNPGGPFIAVYEVMP